METTPRNFIARQRTQIEIIMIGLDWSQIALLALVLAIAAETIVRLIRRPAMVRRIYAIHHELKELAQQHDSANVNEALVREELLIAEVERLLLQVGIDYQAALRQIDVQAEERRVICRRLLEINDEFCRPTLGPDNADTRRQENKLYSEAARLLWQLDLEPSKYLRRRRTDANR